MSAFCNHNDVGLLRGAMYCYECGRSWTGGAAPKKKRRYGRGVALRNPKRSPPMRHTVDAEIRAEHRHKGDRHEYLAETYRQEAMMNMGGPAHKAMLAHSVAAKAWDEAWEGARQVTKAERASERAFEADGVWKAHRVEVERIKAKHRRNGRDGGKRRTPLADLSADAQVLKSYLYSAASYGATVEWLGMTGWPRARIMTALRELERTGHAQSDDADRWRGNF